jgi:TetR/AcrR family transcriptional repressor of nem operon
MGRNSDARSRLLETAMKLMYTRGYTAVGVQEICEHARVNKGSFYHFFPSKRALVLAVIDAYGQRVRDLWQDAMAVDGSLLERMQRVFACACDAQHNLAETSGQMYGCPIGNLALELSCLDEGIRQRLRETFADWADAIEHMLRLTIANGDLPAIDTTTTAQTIVAYFEGVLMLAKIQNDPKVVKQLAQGAVYLVEAAAHTQSNARP